MPCIEKGIIKGPSQIKICLLWGLAVLLAFYFLHFVILNSDTPSHGFASYYTASRLLIEGEEVSRFYNNDWFSSKVKTYVPGIYEIYHVNFPTTTLLLLPLSAFNYTTAKVLWTIFNMLLLFSTIAFLLKKFQFEKMWIPAVLILVFCFQPLYANFSYGQAYMFVFFLLVLAWYAYKTDRDLLLGLIIGFIFIMKSTSSVFFIFLLIQRKWQSFIWALFTVFLVVLLSLPWIGLNAWTVYTEKFISFVSHPSLSVTAYQTIHSLLSHITIFHEQWNPVPIINLPELGKATAIFAVLAILAFTTIRLFNSQKSDLAFSAFVVIGLIVSPVSLDYHYTVMILPVFLSLKLMSKNQSKVVWCVLILFIILIASYIPYTSPKVTEGWIAVLAYPKLYGAAGLWGLFMFYFLKDDFNARKEI